MAVNSLVKQLIKESSNDMASVVSAGILGDCSTFVDTGSYTLNALVSGSLYGGIPSNKMLLFECFMVAFPYSPTLPFDISPPLLFNNNCNP